jgi:hypothetical protein
MDDAECLCRYHLDNTNTITPQQAEQIRNDERTLHLFAANEPRDQFNMQQLRRKHSKNSPVAKLRPTYLGTGGNQSKGRRSHFDTQVLPLTMVCIGAKVELRGRNILPQKGLFNGSMGTIVDIVYNEGQSPNAGHLPRYVLVRFPSYNGKPFISSDPKVIPIVPIQRNCTKHCCQQEFIPLRLCFAKTIHAFQGQQAGPVQPGRPENPIQRLVIDLGTRAFEGKSPGLSYTAFTRPTQIGNETNIMDSALYFTGPHMNTARILNIAFKQTNGQVYEAVQHRSKWVKYLQQHTINPTYSRQDIDQVFAWTHKFRPSETQIDAFHSLFTKQ